MACVRSGLLAAVVLATAAAASAQTTGPPYESVHTARLTGGGEFAADALGNHFADILGSREFFDLRASECLQIGE